MSISEIIIYKSFGITYHFIHQFTNMEEMAQKRNGRWHQEIQKVNFVIKKIQLNTTLNTSKMQNILPKIKTYSLFIKIALPGRRSFKSSLYVSDLSVLLPNFIFIVKHLITRMRKLVYLTIMLYIQTTNTCVKCKNQD